jgi:phytoene desaturase
MRKKIQIIGSGFSSLSAACYLAKSGHEVTVYEKNSTVGGRARQYLKEGFTFDIGPTWYWMPDVFERFFNDFDKKPSDYYELDRLDPAYQVYFSEFESVIISGKLEEIFEAFEKEEPGSSIHLKKFLDSAKFNYNAAMSELVYRPGVSMLELITPETISRVNQFFFYH